MEGNERSEIEYRQKIMVLEEKNRLLRRHLKSVQLEKAELERRRDERSSHRLIRLSEKICEKRSRQSRNAGEIEREITWVILVKGRETDTLCRDFRLKNPSFAGKVLIVDVSGTTKELKEIQALQSAYGTERVRTVSVSAGTAPTVWQILNEVCSEVETEWILYIDPVFRISEPFFPELYGELVQSGCHFMNLPATSAHSLKCIRNRVTLDFRWDSEQEVLVLPAEEMETVEIPEFTRIFTADSGIFRKDTFLRFGKFRPGFGALCGIEFSHRILQQNYAIANFSIPVLIRSEKEVFSCSEADREKYSREIGPIEISGQRPDSRRKVAVIVDEEGWAYYNIAVQLRNNLPQMEIDIFCSKYCDSIPELFVSLKRYDVVHVLWRGILQFLDRESVQRELADFGITYEQFEKKVLSSFCLTTAVYDHLYLEGDTAAVTDKILSVADEYTVSSQKLQKIYENKYEKKPTAEITDGVDLSMFGPENVERFHSIQGRPVTIGWVGNSRFWGNRSEDLKGVHTILNPAIEELQEEGMNLVKFYADKQERCIPHSQMREYYSRIDLYICTSRIEGTPNPLLEAMACGVPVISTDVGIVPEALGEFQRQFILKERTVDSLKKAVRKMLSSADNLRKCSEENLIRIKNWTWEQKCMQYGAFFEAAFDRKVKGRLDQELQALKED